MLLLLENEPGLMLWSDILIHLFSLDPLIIVRRGLQYFTLWYVFVFLFLEKNANERQAEDFLSGYNNTAEQVWNDYTEASWTYNTNITEHNNQVMVRKKNQFFLF